MLPSLNALTFKALLIAGSALLMASCQTVKRADPVSRATSQSASAPLAPLPTTATQSEKPPVPVSKPADTSGSDWIYKFAQVETVSASVSPSNPNEAIITLHGLLHDGATRVNEVQQQRMNNGFVLTVTTARSRQAVASVALIPFERSLTVDISELPPGPCRVSANGILTTLMIP
jgi:hypothetical protein